MLVIFDRLFLLELVSNDERYGVRTSTAKHSLTFIRWYEFTGAHSFTTTVQLVINVLVVKSEP
jgi:hypothetical protein